MKNILSIFRDWDIDPLVSLKEFLCGLAIGAYDWINPRLSCQNKAKQFFEIFDIFAKTKDFPKTTKTLKNILVFDQQRLSM